jgi:regulator of protease activity HflC (stomatin/prohibitin superfamily)
MIAFILANLEDQLDVFPIVVLVVVLITILSGAFTVSNQSVKLIERFGKYIKTARAGLNFKIPYIDSVRATLSLQVQQHVVSVDTITNDKVSVRVAVAVNYQVVDGKEHDAFYQLANPENQIETFVFDVVRSQVPKQTLDEVFDSKDSIAQAVRAELTQDMDAFGYCIIKALVTEIEPDPKVKAAMNDINAAQREREAANARGEAEKVLRVKQAEAQREADRLKGEGIAQQRLAIVDGMKRSVEELRDAYSGASNEMLMNMLMMTQYFETLTQLSGKSNTTTIFVPSTPDSVNTIRQQILEANAGFKDGPRA